MLTTLQKIAIARIAYKTTSFGRRLRGQGDIARFKRKGICWQLDLKQGIDFSIYLLGAFEPGLVRFYSQRIKAGDVVFDIGANLGAHTLHFARLVGEAGQVHAFEATEYAFQKLSKNVALNPHLKAQIHLVHTFLAECSKQTVGCQLQASWPLQAEDNGHLDATYGGRYYSVGEGTGMTLDDYVEQQQLQKIDWLKLDVDGNELSILKGATDLLKRFRPRIIMELAPQCNNEVPQFKPMIELLSQHGYRFYKIPAMKPLSNNAEELLKWIPPGASQNVLLV